MASYRKKKGKKSLWGYISKIYKDLATVRMQMYVRKHPVPVHRFTPRGHKENVFLSSYSSGWICNKYTEHSGLS